MTNAIIQHDDDGAIIPKLVQIVHAPWDGGENEAMYAIDDEGRFYELGWAQGQEVWILQKFPVAIYEEDL